jgi:hypothetical protein
MTVVLAMVVLSTSACKKAAPGGETSSVIPSLGGQPVSLGEGISVSGGNSYARVSLKPQTKVVDEGQIESSLQGVSSDGHVVAFQNASPQIQALKAGDLLLVKNQLARKVLASETDGDMTYLLTDSVSLADLVQDGDIQIDAPLSFNGAPQTSAIRPLVPSLLDIFGAPAYAQQGFNAARAQGTQDAAQKAVKSVLGSVVSGWTVTKYSFTPGANELDFSLVLSKSEQGFVAMVALSGFVTNFEFVTTLGIHNGSGSKIFTGVQKMTGKVHFDWQIGKETPGVWATEDRVKLPAELSINLAPLLGGVPLNLGVSAALLIHPALTGGKELSKGGFTVTWTGGGNISSQGGGAVSSDSTMQETFEITEDQNISPIAPNGMVIVYCAPRLELSLSPFGSLKGLSTVAAGIDKVGSVLMSHLPANLQQAINQSPLSKITATNTLGSSADIWLQFLTTEGVTHTASITPMPCSKQEVKLTAQGGGDANLFGLTSGAKATKDLFTKTYTRWDPASDFCKKI